MGKKYKRKTQMKKLTILFLLALLTFSQAQIPDEYWQWVEPFNTGYSNFGQEVITNSQGNIFVISSGGAWNNYNGLIYKYSPNGELLWYRQFGGSEHDYGTSISVDNVGNVYVTGQFQGTADFGSFNLISTGGMDIFIAKIDSDGNWLWVKHTGSNSDDYGRSISVDNVGNVYVTGSFAGTASFGITTLSSSGSNDIFIAKMDSEGNWLWAEGAGGSSTDVGYSISVDNDGDVYVTGYFEGTADFGNISLSTEGAQDIFVAKIDSSGNWVWAERAGGQTNDYSQSISVTNNGVYITGNFSTLADFGPYTLSSNDIGTNQRDIFIAKLDKNGNWRWAERAGGASGDSGTSITVDNDGDVYVTGYFEGTADFGPFNYTTGTYQEDYNTYYEREMYIGKLIDYGNIIECMFFPNFDGSEYLEFVRALNYDIVIDNTPVFTFIDTIGFPVIILDSTMFFDMYGMLADSLENEGRLFGPLFAELPNDSASIIVLWNDVVMDSFTYRAIDYPETAGLGPSLEKTDSGWGPSFGNGTPGRDNGHGRISLPQDADPFHLNLMPHFDNPITGGDVAFSVFSDLETIVYPSITNDSILVVTPLWFGNDHLTVTAFYEDGSQQERRILTSFNNVFLDVPTQTPEFATIDTVSLNTWYSRTPQDGIFSFSVSSSDSTIVKPSIVQDTLLVLTTHWHGEVTIELTVSSNNDGTFTQTFPVNVPNPFISIIPNQVITNDTTQIHNVIQWFPHPVTEDVTFFVSSLNTDIVQTTLVQDTLLQFDVLNDGNALYGFTDIIVIADYPFNHSVSDTFIFTNNPGNTLVINEIHYNPAGSQGSDAEYEFIELANNSEHTIRLENTVLSNEVNYGFSESTTVLPDSFVVVARNKSSLLAWYSGLNNNIVFEGYSELLSNTTGLLQLSFNGYSLDSLSYSDTAPWPENADGLGSSLELVNPVLDNSDANSWRASLVEGGTPGFENSTFGYVPQWTQVPEMTFYEDIDTTIALSYWFSFVEDIGTPDSALTFSFLNTGQVTVTIADDSAHFSIEENWNGETEIGIRANNGTNYTDAAIPIIVSPVNDTPEITPISNVEYFEDDNLSFVLTSNDIDSEDLTYLGWSDTSAIFVTITDSLISFSSTLNWTGSGLITAAVSDGEYTNSTVFTVTVVPVNDAPVISGIDDSNFPEDSSLVIVLNSSDIENDDVSYTVFSDTSAILIAVEDSAVTLSSNEDWNGESLITAVVSDGEFADSTTFTLTIQPLNDSPFMLELIPDVSINEDAIGVVIINRLENYFGDIDIGDTLTFSTEILGAGLDSVALVMAQDSTHLLAYTVENFVGELTIAITATDDSMATISDTFMVEIMNINDPPVITIQQNAFTNEEIPITIAFSVYDEEGADVIMSGMADTASVIITMNDTTLGVIPELNWFGEAKLFLTADDGDTSVTDTVILTVENVNDVPVLSSDFSEDVLSGFISIPLFVDEVDGDAIQVNGVFRLAQSDNWELMNVNRDTSYGGNVEFSVEWETLDKTGNQINWTYSETAECSLWVNDGFVNSNALVFDSLTIANIAGDYNLDVKINASDIGQLVNVFYDEGAEVLGYDIGPSTGTAPFLITAQDFVIDFEDLATFTQMWYWGAENLPTLNQTILAKSVVSDGNELFSLLAKSNGILTLKISEMMTKGFDLFVQYDTTEIQFENIQSQVGNSAISLAYHQAESGYFSLSVYSKNGIMDFSGDMLEFVVSSKILDVSEIVIGIKMYENPSDDSPFEYYRKTIKSLDLLPKEFALHQNYPNPFNPVTTLRYDLPEQAHVGIIIYDIMGREVIMLVNQSQTPGFKSVVWNGKNSLGIDVSAGMYLYRISAENFHSVKKMVLLK